MKNDYLRECMTGIEQQPIDEFNNTYCVRCINQECSRSKANQTIFVNRVLNWKSNLFDNVPRADDNDEKYDNIRSKKFVPMSNSIQNFKSGAISYEIQTKEIEPKIVEELKSEPKLEQVMPKEPSIHKGTPVTKSSKLAYNTNFQQGSIVKPDAEVVLEPGATFTFGDDNESSESSEDK